MPEPSVSCVLFFYHSCRERRGRASRRLQAMVTNGHCGRKESVMIAKMPGYVLVGADCQETSRTYALPTVVSLDLSITKLRHLTHYQTTKF